MRNEYSTVSKWKKYKSTDSYNSEKHDNRNDINFSQRRWFGLIGKEIYNKKLRPHIHYNQNIDYLTPQVQQTSPQSILAKHQTSMSWNKSTRPCKEMKKVIIKDEASWRGNRKDLDVWNNSRAWKPTLILTTNAHTSIHNSMQVLRSVSTRRAKSPPFIVSWSIPTFRRELQDESSSAIATTTIRKIEKLLSYPTNAASSHRRNMQEKSYMKDWLTSIDKELCNYKL